MGTLTCKIRQRVQKLPGRKSRCFAQKWRKLETSKIRVFCPVGSFNQRARDSSSLERTKIPRRIVRFLVGFSVFWGSAHFCTLFAHRRESRVFPCIVCILCIVAELVGAKPLHLAYARPFGRLKSPLGTSLFRCASQTRTCRGKAPPSCCARPFCRLKSPLGTSLFRCTSQTRTFPRCAWRRSGHTSLHFSAGTG